MPDTAGELENLFARTPSNLPRAPAWLPLASRDGFKGAHFIQEPLEGVKRAGELVMG